MICRSSTIAEIRPITAEFRAELDRMGDALRHRHRHRRRERQRQWVVPVIGVALVALLAVIFFAANLLSSSPTAKPSARNPDSTPAAKSDAAMDSPTPLPPTPVPPRETWRWHRMAIDISGADEGFYLKDIWGTSRTNVWGVGNADLIAHFDGERWTRHESGANDFLEAVWGTSLENVYALGRDGLIRPFNGRNWQAIDFAGKPTIWNVWGTSRDEVWFIGMGFPLFWNGLSWRQIPTPKADLPDANINDGSFAIFGPRADFVTAVGDGGRIIRYDGVGWRRFESPVTVP